MKKKTIGMLITVLVIGTMIVMTVKSNVNMTNSNENFQTGTIIDTLEGESGLELGDTPPDFELSTLTGDVVRLSDYKGKKVILNFWASWCPPCKAEMPYMESYYKNNKEHVEILAVNWTTSERTGIPNIEKFANAYGLTFPIPLDETGEIIEAYGILSPPTTFILEEDGTIAHKILGPVDEKGLENLVGNFE